MGKNLLLSVRVVVRERTEEEAPDEDEEEERETDVRTDPSGTDEEDEEDEEEEEAGVVLDDTRGLCMAARKAAVDALGGRDAIGKSMGDSGLDSAACDESDEDEDEDDEPEDAEDPDEDGAGTSSLAVVSVWYLRSALAFSASLRREFM